MKFSPEDPVQIVAGPFTGKNGRVTTVLENGQRLVVAVEVFGRIVQLALSPEELQPLPH